MNLEAEVLNVMGATADVPNNTFAWAAPDKRSIDNNKLFIIYFFSTMKLPPHSVTVPEAPL